MGGRDRRIELIRAVEKAFIGTIWHLLCTPHIFWENGFRSTFIVSAILAGLDMIYTPFVVS
jgi:hypothetical protein